MLSSFFVQPVVQRTGVWRNELSCVPLHSFSEGVVPHPQFFRCPYRLASCWGVVGFSPDALCLPLNRCNIHLRLGSWRFKGCFLGQLGGAGNDQPPECGHWRMKPYVYIKR